MRTSELNINPVKEVPFKLNIQEGTTITEQDQAHIDRAQAKRRSRKARNLKINRLKIAQQFVDLTNSVADFSKIQS